MRKVKLRNTLIVSILLVILVFSIGSSISLVKADAGGTGKYLGIVFTADEDTDALRNSDCYVTATKETSGQQFIFNATDETDTLSDGEFVSLIKVAAGTVRLTAYPSSGWRFIGFYYYDDGWLGDNNCYYKTEKYGTVEAIFEKIETVDITVSILTEFEVGPDEIYTLGDGRISFDYGNGNGFETIVSNPPGSGVPTSLTISVPVSSTPTFKFIAADGYDLSCAIVTQTQEGGITYYADFIETVHGEVYEYTLPAEIVTTNLELNAIFYADGEAFIPGGTGVTIFLRDQGQNAALSFLGTVGTGISYGTYIAASFDPTDVVTWEITVAADLGNDLVLVALKYPEDMAPEAALLLRIWRTDSDLVAYDLNSDGRIDGQDVKLVSNRLIEPITYDQRYDFDSDGEITTADVNFISNLAGSKIVWEDITTPYIGNLPAGAPDIVYPVDTDNHIVYGFTDHFSIFRGR